MAFELKYMEVGGGLNTESTHSFGSTKESIYQVLGTVKISTSLSLQGVQSTWGPRSNVRDMHTVL